MQLLRQFNKFWLRVWIILYKQTASICTSSCSKATSICTSSKNEFLLWKVKREQKTVWQKWFYEIMFEGPQREESNYVLGCECCKPTPSNILQLSISHSFLGGTPPFLENSMKKNQSLQHLEGFSNIPLPSGKVDYGAIKREGHSVGNTGTGNKLILGILEETPITVFRSNSPE